MTTESHKLSSLLKTAPFKAGPGNRTLATSFGLENVALNLQDVIGALVLGLVFLGVLVTSPMSLFIKLTAQAPSSRNCSTQLREFVKA